LNLKNTIESKMGQNNKVSMPSGMSGLTRYFDEYKSKIKIKPGHIIVMVVVVMAIMIFLYSYGNILLGI
jgi:preprotein translocase subunit Sec61beta